MDGQIMRHWTEDMGWTKRYLLIVAFILWSASFSHAVEPSKACPVPPELEGPNRNQLVPWYHDLEAARKRLVSRLRTHDANCRRVPSDQLEKIAQCKAARQAIENAWEQYETDVEDYEAARSSAVRARIHSENGPADVLDFYPPSRFTSDWWRDYDARINKYLKERTSEHFFKERNKTLETIKEKIPGAAIAAGELLTQDVRIKLALKVGQKFTDLAVSHWNKQKLRSLHKEGTGAIATIDTTIKDIQTRKLKVMQIFINLSEPGKEFTDHERKAIRELTNHADEDIWVLRAARRRIERRIEEIDGELDPRKRKPSSPFPDLEWLKE